MMKILGPLSNLFSQEMRASILKNIGVLFQEKPMIMYILMNQILNIESDIRKWGITIIKRKEIHK